MDPELKKMIEKEIMHRVVIYSAILIAVVLAVLILGKAYKAHKPGPHAPLENTAIENTPPEISNAPVHEFILDPRGETRFGAHLNVNIIKLLAGEGFINSISISTRMCYQMAGMENYYVCTDIPDYVNEIPRLEGIRFYVVEDF